MKQFIASMGKSIGTALSPFFGRLGTNPYLMGIRDGMMSTVPFTIFGSIFVIVSEFPVSAWQNFITPYKAMLNVPYLMTTGILALIVSMFTGYYLGKHLNQDPLSCGICSFVGFMLLQVNQDFSLDTSYFGSRGIFTALVVAVFCVVCIRFFTNRNMVIKFPDSVPPAVSSSFLSLIPTSIALAVLFVVRCVLGIEIPTVVSRVFSPLVFALNSYGGIIIYLMVAQILWCFGIHGMNVLSAVGTPIFITFLTANTEAFMAGEPVPYITALGFIPWFVSLGGSGATLGLTIIMALSKEKSLRTLGRLSLLPNIFEINEPVIFGLPIVLNPVMSIPFVLNNFILATGTYFLMYFNIIGRPVLQVPWIMPPVIGAYLATSCNIPAAIWAFAGILISAIVYYPFIKKIEKQRLS